jgi:hypothetical protein
MRLEAGGEPDLPYIDPALELLVEYLFEAGPVSAVGMGPVTLTWVDLEAWQRATGVSLHPWQARLLRQLSSEYLAESSIADAHDAPPPWDREPDRAKVANHIKRLFRG